MQLIQTVDIPSGGAALVSFTAIPQDGTDLVILTSLRSKSTSENCAMSFNTGGTYNTIRTGASGTSVFSSTTTSLQIPISQSSWDINTFNNATVYIPNYAGGARKICLIDGANERNATSARREFTVFEWNQTAAITSINLSIVSPADFEENSTASLYKITKA
jgi:hypothetical protein